MKAMSKRQHKTIIKLCRKLFVQEAEKFPGTLKFAYLKDDETGELCVFSPDRDTSKRLRKLLETEFEHVT